MPKIKIDNTRTMQRERTVSTGLRSDQHLPGYDPRQMTQREKDDCFDMYRTERKGVKSPAPRKKNGRLEIPQLWFVASIISALGMFCIMTESVVTSYGGFRSRYTSFEILFAAMKDSSATPFCMIGASLMPLAFLFLFISFALLKERSFEKGSLAIIAVSVMIIILDIHWMTEISGLTRGYLEQYTPGFGIVLEMGCCLALIILVTCERILNHFWFSRSPYGKW